MSNPVRLGFLWIFLSLAVPMLNACCYFNTLRPLDQAEESNVNQDFADIAAMEVKCNESCDGCNQLHLIKGDACYRLAKAGQAPEMHFACAAAELEAGIRLTPQLTPQEGMKDNHMNRIQVFANLCDALRNLRDLSRGAAADTLNTRLWERATEFLNMAPDNACALYFLNNARFAELRVCLLHPETCPDLCSRLISVEQSLSREIASGVGSECAPNLRELRREVGQAEQITRCPRSFGER